LHVESACDKNLGLKNRCHETAMTSQIEGEIFSNEGVDQTSSATCQKTESFSNVTCQQTESFSTDETAIKPDQAIPCWDEGFC
jgi:hypothetical protein